jgi:DNA-directed RNA polymerase subunit beta'
VDVAQDCIIMEVDCGTERGLNVRAIMDGADVVSSLSERILGRTAQEDVVDPVSGEVLVKHNDLIDERWPSASSRPAWRG